MLGSDTSHRYGSETYGVRNLLLLQELNMHSGRKLLHCKLLAILHVLIASRTGFLEPPPFMNISGLPARHDELQIGLVRDVLSELSHLNDYYVFEFSVWCV